MKTISLTSTRWSHLGSGAQRKTDNIKLSRYACYLVVQNADPGKEAVGNDIALFIYIISLHFVIWFRRSKKYRFNYLLYILKYYEFDFLVQQIESTHVLLNQAAVKAVNIHLALRNWLIGFYIIEFEQVGEDRTEYGAKLLPSLSATLKKKGLSNINERELRRYRLFYQIYPGLGNVFSKSLIRGTVSPENNNKQMQLTLEKLINNLSFSHLAELIEVEDPLKRNFCNRHFEMRND